MAAVLAMVTSMAPADGEARTLSRTADRLPAGSYYLPRTSTQLIVGVAEDWNSNRVVLQASSGDRVASGNGWVATWRAASVPVVWRGVGDCTRWTRHPPEHR